MLKNIIERLIRKQEAMTGESADFLRDLYAGSPTGFWRFALFLPMSRHRGALPLDAACAVRIAAVHAEHCGPCLQTVINLSLAAGARPEILRAAVEDDRAAMDEETRLAFEFAKHLSAREHLRLANAFSAAIASADPKALIDCLSEDVVFYSDGGGKAIAALNPLFGPDHVTRFFMGILKKRPQNFVTLPATVNGLPGFIMKDENGVHSALSFGVSDGRISTLYMIRNPDKLTRIELP